MIIAVMMEVTFIINQQISLQRILPKRLKSTLNNYPRTSCTESATALITVSICSFVKLNQTGSVISL